MNIESTRFGRLQVEPEELLEFPSGLYGLEQCKHWVLLADAQNDALGWLQCTTRPDVAVAVVTPRRFVRGYQVRVPRTELTPLGLDDVRDAKVLVIVGRNDRSITLNLKAPLVINLKKQIGRQVVVNNDLAIQHELMVETMSARISPHRNPPPPRCHRCELPTSHGCSLKEPVRKPSPVFATMLSASAG
jgi:flagellar assembly factor FliW